MKSVHFKLSAMMFLEFFIMGAWMPLLPSYLDELGIKDSSKAWILNAFAIASITAMFFSTQFADRNFAAERFLAFSHLVGGLAILSLAWVSDFWSFFLLMLLYALFYVPTISFTNSIAFANLKDPQKEFGLVRLWGTIGWIAVTIPFIFILVDWNKVQSADFVTWVGEILGSEKSGTELHDAKKYIFIIAGAASLVLAGFSLLLPHTPPRPAQQAAEKFALLEVVKLLRFPYILILFVVTFIDATVHSGYFFFAANYLKSIGIKSNWIMPVMSMGQIAEIGTMAILGMCLKRLGWRNVMVLGVLGHTIRFGMFALVPVPWVAITVNLLHGVCYAFFFATVYIFVDEFFPKDARNSAQGMFNFLIWGLGPFVGNFIWAYVEGLCTKPIPELPRVAASLVGNAAPTEFGEVSALGAFLGAAPSMQFVEYHELFLIPSGLALVGALLLLFFFHPPKNQAAAPPATSPH